ncbi:temperature-induced lipocalin-1-like [Cajanus cajan]|uniref:temperature-induced lipocalin-1 n=1 Tax=Cajanus cajan TaxID=3821 RepID=UPI00098D9B9C|nr:temperature-induced lipocalin-1 [Cajanus cajan]XP_029126414.1 temperature-induced lipocalin-1-like [Cajanus cajan]
MNEMEWTRVRPKLVHGKNVTKWITLRLRESEWNVKGNLRLKSSTLKPHNSQLKQTLTRVCVFCSVAPPSPHVIKRNAFSMANKAMEVVKGLDLARYMGRWYEIACFPSRFQPSDGVNTRATYTLKDDGTVNVLNETWSAGKRSFIEGYAYKADPNSDEAKLKVKFWVPPFLPVIPVTGDYWVLYIDPDYQIALVGQPSRNCLWILSRKNHLDDEIYNELVERARNEGYDVSKLHKTPQTNPPPEEEGPEDTKGVWWIKSLLGR